MKKKKKPGQQLVRKEEIMQVSEEIEELQVSAISEGKICPSFYCTIFVGMFSSGMAAISFFTQMRANVDLVMASKCHFNEDKCFFVFFYAGH